MHVVITGAAGALGQVAIEALEGRHTLTLMDLRPHPSRPCAVVDLADPEALLAALPAADVVLHLGAIPNETRAQDIVRNNLLGTTNLFEAARSRGIPRVVFASTLQVYGALTSNAACWPLHPERHAAPNSHYALSKLHGEFLGAMLARRYGMAVLCVRIGWFIRTTDPLPPNEPPAFVLSVRDAQHLFLRCVEAEHTGFATLNGMSLCAEKKFDLETGRRVIGFEPRDSAEEAMRQFLAQRADNPALVR